MIMQFICLLYLRVSPCLPVSVVKKTFIMDNQLKQDHFKVKIKEQEEGAQYLAGRGAQINTKNKFLKK